MEGLDSVVEHLVSRIGFVWRPEEIGPAVIQMAWRTGSRAVFDCSMMELDELRSFLHTADPAGTVRDIKISVPVFLDSSLGQLLKETGVHDIWVECHPRVLQEDPSGFLERLRHVPESYRCFPIIGDLELLAAILKDSSGIGRIVLKGCEAAGFVSSETTMALYSMVKASLRTLSAALDIFIWGGIATPEAAAAFLSTGAAGIICESVHWLTDLAASDDVQRRRLSLLRLDSTDLVGLDLQVPCRLFNKGNSQAFREIRALEDSLCAEEITDDSRRCFIGQVHARAIHPLASHFSHNEVIALGVEAAFAAGFVERFGSGTGQAVQAFMDEIRTISQQAETKKDCFLDSPVARELGTRYPFIQGAMSWITDVPEFAARVADAGGLPTIALGLMDAEALDLRLGHLPKVMGGRPYAVNFVSLAENPFREIQLAWIRKHRPRFVVIAGGDLSPVRALIESGIEVMYIAPDEALLGLALEAGVRYVIVEGYEAGGHVGQHSTLTLAQMLLNLKQRTPALFGSCRVIFAGGIFNRETAFLAAMLGADAIQMGTAYLAAREILETGALTALYQRMVLESRPGGTTVSGRHTGLRVRSLKTPKVAAIAVMEREFAAGHQDEASFRSSMEEIAAGSLFTAARGMDRPGGGTLDEHDCLERGQFMSGACAGLIVTARTLKSFHRELAAGPLVLHHPAGGGSSDIIPEAPLAEPGRGLKHMFPLGDGRERIAITGMSILNALGKSPEEVWAASLAMKSGITLVPPSRWDHALFFDPRPQVPDKTYCTVGAFVDFSVSRTDLGIPPHDFRTMTEATRVTLWLAQNVIRESGILDSDIPRERIGVIISQNSGEAAGTLTHTIIRAYVHDILGAVKRAMPLTPDQERAIEREVKSGRAAPDDTSLLGRLNCAAAGFICNRYGFMGPSYSVSAACATSFVALYSAIQMIRNGIIDVAIVGGGEERLTHMHFLEFSALGALYGLSGQQRSPQETSRPFDVQRDGMVLGEGGGMIIIERESLARSRGARVHAFVTGVGASNNHLGMVESSNVTQQMAIRASFRGLPYGPDAVDLVESHGTSTRQGDPEEVRALKTVFNSSKRTVISAFKSQIGHTLGASGINSLIRGVTAMQAGVFPPTLNYVHPDPDIDLEGSGFLIAPEPLDWKIRRGLPRRFEVNAFGFGGSNYVVQVEQDLDETDRVLVSPGREPGWDAEQECGPCEIQGVSFFRTEMDGRVCRMAAVAPSEEAALALIQGAAFPAEPGIAAPGAVRPPAQPNIFIRREEEPSLPLAFVFPGQGSQYAGMGRELYEAFPVIRQWMDRIADAADFDLLHLLFYDREENLQKTRWHQPATFAMEHAMARYLTSLGIHPVAMAGHSLGELTALCLAGVFSPEDGFRIVNKRALCMNTADGMHMDSGIMAAVDAPLDMIKELLQGRENVWIGNINSPQQIVLSGTTEAVRKLCELLKNMGHRATLLRVSMAFHSPVMQVIRDELAPLVAAIPFYPPQIPVISNTTMAPYPSDPVEIRRILMAHLENPVCWMSNVQTLWNDYAVRLFLEVGPGEALSNLIADTLPEPACIQTCFPSEEVLTCRRALAQIFVHGHVLAAEPKFVRLSALRELPAAVSAIPDAAAAPDEAFDDPDLMERLIHIIMDATGFNRDEIRPDMDLRKDLSIRSSRLPVIMDAAERQFGITIEFDDFMDVRTVKDIAQRISGVIAVQGDSSPRSAANPARNGVLNPAEDGTSVQRLIFKPCTLLSGHAIPISFSSGESLLLLAPDSGEVSAARAKDIFRQDYGVDTFPLLFMQANDGSGDKGCDIRTDEGSGAAEMISGMASHAGMVIVLPQDGVGGLHGMEDVAHLLRGLFVLLKAFLQLPDRKCVVLIHSGQDAEPHSRLVAEGMLGVFLSAAQEYPSVQFRTVEVERDTDLRVALRAALNRGCPVVEHMHRAGAVFTTQGDSAPLVFGDSPRLALSPGDVVVMSGGATGISAHLARCLAPFSPRLVFLGRTPFDPDMNSTKTHSEDSSSQAVASDHRASEIARTLADLRASGIEATYHTCDVTDPDAVRAVMAEVARRYGRIDGIIHGAGVLRDGPVRLMTAQDFSMVADVKFLGAWNLFSSAKELGLRFFAGLSSVAAIQGNAGQANYAAANRMMSALLRKLRRENGSIRFKALMLPPVEGVGMAEDPDVRALLKLKGVAYIHVNELTGLFCRELFLAPDEDDWVLFMRKLPSVRTALLNVAPLPVLRGESDGGAVCLSPGDFPMIEKISCLDLRREELEAFRAFSTERDLWIADHRPCTFVKHALVSAAMILETFMEAARVLYPHLQVRGVRRVRLNDMIQCPPGVARPCTIVCRRTANGLREVVCEVELAAQTLSSAGRLTDRFIPHCTGQVFLAGRNGGTECGAEGFADFPVRPDELRTKPANHNKVLQWYKKRSGLQGRYRVLESIEGAGPGVVRGRTIYRETDDFAHLHSARYQYSPYLFEALVQLAVFHLAATDPSERRALIPVEIGNMEFARTCRAGEQIILEARLRVRDDEGFVWDARGIDDQGRAVMQLQGVRLHWVSA